MKEKLLILLVMMVFCGFVWGAVISSQTITGTDFNNDINWSSVNGIFQFNGVIPIQNGANVRSVNINFTSNSMMVQTNAQ